MPLKHDPEAPLWVNQEGNTKFELMKWRTFKQIVQKYAKRAGIKKRIYPYLFRHRDASWKSDWMTAEQLNQDKGWVQDSRRSRPGFEGDPEQRLVPIVRNEILNPVQLF